MWKLNTKIDLRVTGFVVVSWVKFDECRERFLAIIKACRII
jgi:hypothetical protein